MTLFDEKPIEYSAEWKGPVKNRSCTDSSCLIIFLIFMTCWVAVGYYALTHDGIQALQNQTGIPVDSSGRRCGYDDEVENAPFLMFFDLTKCSGFECNTTSVCREECPDKNWSINSERDPQTVESIRKNIICKTDIDVTTKNETELRQLIYCGDCAKWYLKSKSFKGRCIPESVPPEFTMFISESQSENARDVFSRNTKNENFIDEARAQGITILKIIGIGASLCLLYLILLRWFAFQLTLIAAGLQIGLYSYGSYYFYKIYEDNSVQDNSLPLTLCIICGIMAGVTVLIVLVSCLEILAACALIEEAAKAVMSISSSLLYPIFPSLLQVAAMIYCIITFECLFENKLLETWKFRLLLTINIVGFIWFQFFITALGQMILAFAFASWYWTFDKLNVPYFTVLVGAWKTFRYHLGTVAFGSILITICRIIRIFLEAANPKNADGLAAAICAIIWCFVIVCIRALEKFLKFMNRNAYIICAIYGEGLCSSASVAMSLIIRNAATVIVLNNVVSWVLWLGKVLITVSMGLLAWRYYSDNENFEENYWIKPVVVVVIGTWFVASAFFNVFIVAVDTIFLCFLEDSERNDGSSSRPYYMSRNLQQVLYTELE